MVDIEHSHTKPDTIILKCDEWDFAILRARVEPHGTFLAYFDSLHQDNWGRRWINEPPNVVDCLLQYLLRSDYSLSKIVWPEYDADERRKEEGNDNKDRLGQVESNGLQEGGEERDGEEGQGDQMDVDEGNEGPDYDLGELSIEDALEIHVELFILGRRHNCSGLCDKASTKFNQILNKENWTIDEVMPALRNIWANWVVTATLRKIVCSWLILRAGELTSNQTFLFEAHGPWPTLLIELVDVMSERLRGAGLTGGSGAIE
ncbi:hypothetical protein PRZ48_004170 [Zasmidium cellare]|uniref:Uncharacterized protein n=1 Tax=Zasmidium cellare TaxID=395010 RepID=A0ABR0EYR2_ZASCE|nr:hypothetical protein PRZ48_004170 [Zasmidium cellare]